MDIVLFFLVATVVICFALALLALLAEPVRSVALLLAIPGEWLLCRSAWLGDRYTRPGPRTLARDITWLAYQVTYWLARTIREPLFRSHRLAVHAGVVDRDCQRGLDRAGVDLTRDCFDHDCGECDKCSPLGHEAFWA